MAKTVFLPLFRKKWQHPNRMLPIRRRVLWLWRVTVLLPKVSFFLQGGTNFLQDGTFLFSLTINMQEKSEKIFHIWQNKWQRPKNAANMKERGMAYDRASAVCMYKLFPFGRRDMQFCRSGTTLNSRSRMHPACRRGMKDLEWG